MQAYYVVGLLLALAVAVYGDTSVVPHSHCVPQRAAQLTGRVLDQVNQIRSTAMYEGRRFASFCPGYANTVVHNGKKYATLHDASPSSSDAGCEHDSYRGIQGPWWFAPNDADSQAVIAAYPWGTDRMVLSDRSSYNTQRYTGVHSCTDPLMTSGDQHKVGCCSYRILLRCDAAAEEAAQRHREEKAAQRRREEEQAAQRHSEEEAAQRRHEEEALEEVLEEAAQRRCEEEVLEDAAKRKAEETSAKAAAKKKADAEAAAAKAAAKRKAEEMSAKAAAKKKAEETSAKAATKKAMAEANEAAHTGSKASEAVEIATVEKVAKKVAKRKPVSQKTFKNATPVSSMIANESHNTTYNGKLKVSGLKHARASTVGKSVREVHCQWLR